MMNYNSSKAALVALVRTAALETMDAGITAKTILPGTMTGAAIPFADWRSRL
jgi:NAD(P)-dependent dehydrogenase (short-subunit alcohol dehydrogenase family)